MRYFMLYEDRLDYYKSKGDPAPIGMYVWLAEFLYSIRLHMMVMMMMVMMMMVMMMMVMMMMVMMMMDVIPCLTCNDVSGTACSTGCSRIDRSSTNPRS
jgi:hypothetical protein